MREYLNMMIYECSNCGCEWLINTECSSCVSCNEELISDDYIGQKYLYEEEVEEKNKEG